MSDFVSRDMLPELWEEILKRHWTFLETEESLEKLEERKKLEGCLKEFLSIVPQDRKFFLPETANVLKKSIREMSDFTAYKAIVGFESISQYANNLFTKPWRKEFRVLKLYSGFYQHEIKSNLVDAEQLFEAMGYRRVSDEILVMDGPICPDQVTNVSRDAMAAYVECQIMKNIYSGLVASGLNCTWQDVYYYREKYIGGASQTIKNIGYAMQELRMRKAKTSQTENAYATIQHTNQAPMSAPSQCPNCEAASYRQQQAYYMQQATGAQCPLHTVNIHNGNSCALHTINQKFPYNGVNTAHNGTSQQPHMSHSRSLDHYNEQHRTFLPHRHSFDHQQQGCTAHHYQQSHTHMYPHSHIQNVYESPYDCLDGVSMGSSASYAAVTGAGLNNGMNSAFTHPYNVSGNRYPLPHNISNQLNSHYDTPAFACKNNLKVSEPYSNLESAGNIATSKIHNCNYQQHQQLPPPPVPPTRNMINVSQTLSASKCNQMVLPPDQLIDFDDRAALTAHDYHAQLHSLRSQNQSLDSFEHVNNCYYDQRRGNINSTYAQPKDALAYQQQQMSSSATEAMFDNSCLYARPLPRSNRIKATMEPSSTDKYIRNSDLVQDCTETMRKMELLDKNEATGGIANSSKKKSSLRTNNELMDQSDVSYESTNDDFVNVVQRSPTQAKRNQDGVGSFDSWNFVFQNLERSGYSKDLGERGDMLMNGIDINTLNISNGDCSGTSSKSTEKKRQTQIDSKFNNKTVGNNQKLKNEKTVATTNRREVRKVSGGTKQEKSILKPQNTNSNVGSTTKKKSALKSSTSTSTGDNNNVNGNIKPSESNIKRNSTVNAGAIRYNGSKLTISASPQTNGVPKEWSCTFCTFLNPETKRICEMCSHSKDFKLMEPASVSNTPTCV